MPPFLAPTTYPPTHPPSVYSGPRVTDATFNFLLVWYYCTLTIRESILINNGSRWVCVWGAPGGGWPLPISAPPSLGAEGPGVTGLLPQDQRLVGDASLRVHLPVGRHADLVSGLGFPGPGWGWGREEAPPPHTPSALSQARRPHVPEVPEPVPVLLYVPE